MRFFHTILIAAAIAGVAQADEPIVIGHRGASGYRPEHTLASYELAMDQGADFVEPDLVMTKDGVLVCRHENEISGTTDVSAHPEFALRFATKTIDGVPISGWFTEDFTLAELKTLRAKERIPLVRPQNATYDGRFEVPTLQEMINLVQGRKGKPVGIYPETKHPTYFQSIGLPMEESLVAVLHANGYKTPNDRCFIQSFETANLRQLSGLTKLPLVQLVSDAGKPYDFVVAGDPRTYADMITPAGLADIAEYADGIGANKNLIIPRNSSGFLLAPTTLVRDAHEERLVVHGWTFRAENTFLPADFRIGSNPIAIGDLPGEVEAFLETGMDGFFTDQPDIGVEARDDFWHAGTKKK